jgi:hypothetical protein
VPCSLCPPSLSTTTIDASLWLQIVTGSTNVRVGSSIFGSRLKKDVAAVATVVAVADVAEVTAVSGSGSGGCGDA